eukprot:1855466-Karenia_brevis.AAC.1
MHCIDVIILGLTAHRWRASITRNCLGFRARPQCEHGQWVPPDNPREGSFPQRSDSLFTTRWDGRPAVTTSPPVELRFAKGEGKGKRQCNSDPGRRLAAPQCPNDRYG